MFSKLEMLGEGQEVHEAPFVITTNGEKNVIVGKNERFIDKIK
jgi:hypothetical protein